MVAFLRTYKVLFIIPLLSLIIAAFFFFFFFTRPVCAHGPHDETHVVILSPNYEQDQTLFIIMTVWWLRATQLFMSTDSGRSWLEAVNGLDGHCGLTSVAISPAFEVDKTVFVSSRGNGIYKSTDGGESWFGVNNKLGNLDISAIAISPNYHLDGTILAAGRLGGLYKSKNGGESWYPLMGRWSKDISTIAFFPANPEANYILAGDRKKGRLYFSTDQGEDWTKFSLPTEGKITALAVSPDFFEDSTYFVGTSEGEIFKVNAGQTFQFEVTKLPLRDPHKDIMALAISPNYGQDQTIFASTWYESVFLSSDGGRTWQKDTTGITTDAQADRFDVSHFYDLGISNTFAKDGVIFLAGFDGVFKSTDGGRVWAQVEALAINYITSLAISPAYNEDQTIAFATYHSGAFITYDAGQTWRSVDHNKYIKQTRLYNIVFHPAFPADDALLMFGAGAFYKMSPSGANLTYAQFDEPDVAIPIFAISPNLASDNTLYVAAHNTRRLFKSTDGGATWTLIWRPEGVRLSALAISPNFAADKTLYAGVSRNGLYKTTDGGATWQPINSGLNLSSEEMKPFFLVISPNYKQDQTVFVATEKNLFKTTNGGKRWRQLENLADGKTNPIMTIAISPNYRNDETLLISLKGKGLFKSTDGGTTFVEIGPALIEQNHLLRLIEFSPAYGVDNAIYGVSDTLFRSTDGGNTWQVIDRPRRYEDTEGRDVIHYAGQWETVASEDFGGGSIIRSNDAGDTATLNFRGQCISLMGTQGPAQGMAKVYIDGQLNGELDQYSPTRQVLVPLYTVNDLDYGNHTIMVEVSDTKDPESSDYWIEIDGFDIDSTAPNSACKR